MEKRRESRAAYITMGQMRNEGNTLGALAAENIVYMNFLRVCFYFVGSFREPTLHL